MIYYLVAFLSLSFVFNLPLAYSQQETNSVVEVAPTLVDESDTASDDIDDPSQITSTTKLLRMAWAASNHKDLERLNKIVDRCFEIGSEAKSQQAALTNFPPRGSEKDYQTLNDVATCFFVKAEALMNNGQTMEAIALFQNIMSDYKWAQAWDPRGWYWSVAEKSQASLDMLSGTTKVQEVKVVPVADFIRVIEVHRMQTGFGAAQTEVEHDRPRPLLVVVKQRRDRLLGDRQQPVDVLGRVRRVGVGRPERYRRDDRLERHADAPVFVDLGWLVHGHER